MVNLYLIKFDLLSHLVDFELLAELMGEFATDF